MKYLLLLVSLCVYGDTVTMRNGDRLTGAIVRIDSGSVQLRSDVVGEVKIPREKVERLSSANELAVLLKNGSTIQGRVSTNSGFLIIEGSSVWEEPLESVKMVLSPPEYEREERLSDPSWLELWKGSLDTGLSAARGNTEATTVNLAMNATRITRKDQLNLHGSALYARNQGQGFANALRAGFKYDYNVDGGSSFLFIQSDAEHDQLQKLDLRTVVGAGGGHHTVRTPKTTLDLFGGGSMNRELFATGLHRLSAEALGGQELAYKLSKNVALREKITIFPNLSQLGEFRVTLDSSAVTAINKWIGWQTSISNRYLSNPLEGTTKNDILLTTGFRFNFAN